MSVGLHYVSPASFESGLFHRVIMESNYPGSNLHSMEDASKLGNDFCRILECFAVVTGHCDVECMRSQNASMVQNAWRMSQDSIATTVATNSLGALLDSIMAFAPVIDGDLISCKITDCLMQGSFNPAIDAMFGTSKYNRQRSCSNRKCLLLVTLKKKGIFLSFSFFFMFDFMFIFVL